MRYDRLLAAARAVEESPNPAMFTMRRVMHICGTPACVLGHYGARTDLQDQYQWNDYRGFEDAAGRNLVGWSGGEHFEIDWIQFDELFGVLGCAGAKTPVEAGRYIRDFVARHGGPVT